jgi:hypothetical protein
MTDNSFDLDGICPSEAGKVAGVKVEIHDEKLAGGAEGMARFERVSVAISGNSREKTPTVAKLWRGRQKAQKRRNCLMASQRVTRLHQEFRDVALWEKGMGRGMIGGCREHQESRRS